MKYVNLARLFFHSGQTTHTSGDYYRENFSKGAQCFVEGDLWSRSFIFLHSAFEHIYIYIYICEFVLYLFVYIYIYLCFFQCCMYTPVYILFHNLGSKKNTESIRHPNTIVANRWLESSVKTLSRPLQKLVVTLKCSSRTNCSTFSFGGPGRLFA